MYLLICGQPFCKIALKILKERIHLVFTLEHLHFMPFKSQQHLESRSSYTAFFLKPTDDSCWHSSDVTRSEPAGRYPGNQPLPLPRLLCCSRASWPLLGALGLAPAWPSFFPSRLSWPTPAASHSFPGFPACRGLGNASQVRQRSAFFTAGSFAATRRLPPAALPTCAAAGCVPGSQSSEPVMELRGIPATGRWEPTPLHTWCGTLEIPPALPPTSDPRGSIISADFYTVPLLPCSYFPKWEPRGRPAGLGIS